MKPELFTRENINDITWPSTADGEYARRYLLPMNDRWRAKVHQEYLQHAINARQSGRCHYSHHHFRFSS